MKKIIFIQEEMTLFELASNDNSFLHSKKEYARETAFGECIVYGGMAVLKCLQYTRINDEDEICQVEVEYIHPLFIGQEYTIFTGMKYQDCIKMEIYLDEMLMVKVVFYIRKKSNFFRFYKVSNDILENFCNEKISINLEHSNDDLSSSLSYSHPYYLRQSRFSKLRYRFKLTGYSASLIQSILLFSYISGMILPGKRGMSLGYQFHIDENWFLSSRRMKFKTVSKYFDKNLGLFESSISAGNYACRINGELKALVLEDLERLADSSQSTHNMLTTGGFYNNKNIFITGGSRGLGVEYAKILAAQGGRVIINYNSSDESVSKLIEEKQATNHNIIFLKGNISSEEDCKKIDKWISSNITEIDILILNAFPAISSPYISYCSSDKQKKMKQEISNYVKYPLHYIGKHVVQEKGIILFSSVDQESNVGNEYFREIKLYMERLIIQFVKERRSIQGFFIRLPKMRTVMNNTPLGLINVMDPQKIAGAVILKIPELQGKHSYYIEKFIDLESDPELYVIDQVKEAFLEEKSDLVYLSSTFVTEPFLETIELWSDRLNLNLEGECGQYNQIFQCLLNPDYYFQNREVIVHAILLKVDDWIRFHSVNSLEDKKEFLEKMTVDFIEAVGKYCTLIKVKTYVIITPSKIDVNEYEEKIFSALNKMPAIDVICISDHHEQYDIDEVFDDIRDQMGHLPYTSKYYDFLGTYIIRRYYNFINKPYKVIVLDCDNTLWQGICGEVGDENVKINGAYYKFQEFLLEKYNEGFLLCLCSKNNEQDVWKVFENNPDMLLKRTNIVDAQINWNKKSDNIRELSERLNLGLDSFIFFDDNPIERAEVEMTIPEVLVIDSAINIDDEMGYLDHFWPLDKYGVTIEDKKRTEMYKTSVKANDLRKSSSSYKEFLGNLQLSIAYHEVNDESIGRTIQLLERTNQFNFSNAKWIESEVNHLIKKEGYTFLNISVKDRFGDYGIVGVMAFSKDQVNLSIHAFVLSCRVLGRGVEHRMVSKIGELALDEGIQKISIHFVNTEKNNPAKIFLESLNPAHLSDHTFTISAEILKNCTVNTSEPPMIKNRSDDNLKLPVKLRKMDFMVEISKKYYGIDKFGEESEVKTNKTAIYDDVLCMLAEIIGIKREKITEDEYLETYINTSIGIIDATAKLSRLYKQIPVTILFEYKTFREVADYIASLYGSESKCPEQEHQKSEDIPINEEDKEEVAIIGIGLKYPGAENPEMFWDILQKGKCVITEVPSDRWETELYYDQLTETPGKSHNKWGGFIKNVYQFDAKLFHLSPVECRAMDPQQRLFLQVVWHLLEDAGYTPESIDRNTGVFLGIVSNDYGMLANDEALSGNGYIRATDYYQVANRISYFYDLHGPSMAVDTACSSSGTALALAYEQIKAGKCETAIVGGVNLFLHPSRHVQYSKMGMLSTEQKCCPFGKEAKGTIFGEGIGAVMLKSLSAAERDGDNIYCTINGYAMNSGGRTNGFTVPNPGAQADLILHALENANITPDRISYVEAHGTGTPLGDPIEVRGLTKAFNKRMEDLGKSLGSQYCSIGSLKGNIGHLESGALISSLIKVMLQMKNKCLVKTLNADELNPQINFADTPFYVQQNTSEWKKMVIKEDGQVIHAPRIAGISSFGAGGSNFHIIIQEYEKGKEIRENNNQEYLLPFTARTESNLIDYLERFLCFLETNTDVNTNIKDIAYTLQTGRVHFLYRTSIIAATIGELKNKLRDLLEDIKYNVSKANVVGEAIDEEGHTLDEISVKWKAGHKINWERLYQEIVPKRVSLPLLSFDGDIYKIKVSGHKSNETRLLDGICIEKSIDKGIVYYKEMDPKDSMISEHVVNGKAIMPGVGYVAMIFEAAEQLYQGKVCHLKNILWLSPFELSAGKCRLYLSLQVSDELMMAKLYSIYQGVEKVHAQAEVTCEDEMGMPPKKSLSPFKHENMDRFSIYKKLSDIGIQFGDSYKNLKEVFFSDDGLYGYIETNENKIGVVPLMDAPLQAAQVMARNNELLFPFSAEEISVYSAIKSGCRIFVKENSKFYYDIVVTDQEENICALFKGIEFKEACSLNKTVDLNENKLYYRFKWVEESYAAGSENSAINSNHTYIFYNDDAEPLMKKLRIFYQISPSHCVHLNLEDNWNKLERYIEAVEHIDTMFFLGAIANEPDMQKLEQVQKTGVLSFFRMVKIMGEYGLFHKGLKIRIITNNIFSVLGSERLNPLGADIHGFSRSCAKEYPFLDILTVDIDNSEVFKESDFKFIMNRISDETDVDFAIRNGRRYKKIIERTTFESVDVLPFRENGVYIILGGAGGIGLKFSQYIAHFVQAKIVWIGRNNLTQEKAEMLDILRSSGSEVSYIQADACKFEELESAIEKVRNRYGVIHGVVHSAIVLNDKSIARMKESELKEIMDVKVLGSHFLFDSIKDEKLDFYMVFSSTQAVAGNPGQSNYAGGCSFKDAYANYIRVRYDVPVHIINWGYWGGTGIVANSTYKKKLHDQGYFSLSSEEGMEAIKTILNNNEHHIMVGKISEKIQRDMGLYSVSRDLIEDNRVVDLEVFLRGFAETQELVRQMILYYIQRRGLSFSKGKSYTYEEFKQILAVADEYLDLAEAMLNFLEKHAYIQKFNKEFKVITEIQKIGTHQIEALKKEIFNTDYALFGHNQLVWNCLNQLDEIISGLTPATDIIFPKAQMNMVEHIFKGNANADYCNALVAEHVLEYLQKYSNSNRKVRILEIGAGTGGTSAHVIKRIADFSECVEYCYTDISRAFLIHGKRLLKEYSFIEYKLLDIEKDPGEQGFQQQYFDLIIATNVLHATKNINNTIYQTGQLLANRGYLLLNEITEVLDFDTFTFGLLKGWWLFEDPEYRLKDSPLLSKEKWEEILISQGFSDIKCSDTKLSDLYSLFQNVFCAIKNKEGDQSNVDSSEGSNQEGDLFQIKQSLINSVCECLGIEQEELEEGMQFSEMGIDSILAVDLIMRLNQILGIKLRTTVIFDYSNIEELCQFIHKEFGQKMNKSISALGSDQRQTNEVIKEAKSHLTITSEQLIPCLESKDATVVWIEEPSNIDGITLKKVPINTIRNNEVKIKVKAASLNFADYLTVKGLYPNAPDYPVIPGFEVSGVVMETGENTRLFHQGDEVIALMGRSLGGQSSIVIVEESMVVKKPANCTYAEACSYPITFLTAYLGLQKAAIKRGEKILIQTAAGGVGLMALQLAQYYGAEIYATVGSQQKAEYLQKMGIRQIIQYETEDFEKRIFEMTNGYGVDVVLNMLSGNAIQKGLNILAPEGRYIEIAMMGLKSSVRLDLSRLTDNQEIYSIDLSKYLYKSKEVTQKYLKIMATFLEQRNVLPVINNIVPLASILTAYRKIEDRENIGKIVVDFSENVVLGEKKSEDDVQDKECNNEYVSKNKQIGTMDIAIIGMAGKFPGADNVEEFWNNLTTGVSSVKEVPAKRWNHAMYYSENISESGKTNCKWGGFLDNIDEFDPMFFRMSGKEAEMADPQQRLFLQETYKALENAGYTAEHYSGLNCGIYVGAIKGDYYLNMRTRGGEPEAQAFTGNEASVLAARISYYLNLKGPAVAVDTACSSSLVAIHQACSALIMGDCEMAVAGGAFLINSPDFYVLAGQTGMLSPEGRCKTFDDQADGFVPGECVASIVLKPLDKAQKDGDNIYGVIKGSGVNQDGKTNGLTAPSALSQQELEQKVYQKYHVNPEEITYIETHGTGTKLGDPIEIQALTDAFHSFTDRTSYCALGSVKTNIGHAAQAAGIASFIKVLLSLKYKQICPTLNFYKLNSDIELEGSPFYINKELIQWNVAQNKRRMAAVSAFGMSGTNCHIVIEEYGQNNIDKLEKEKEWKIPISAKTEQALRKRLVDINIWIMKSEHPISLANIAYTLIERREQFRCCCIFSVKSIKELSEQIKISLQMSRLGESETKNNIVEKFQGTYQNVSLPCYPFEKERYWHTKQDQEDLIKEIYPDAPYIKGHQINQKFLVPGAVSIAIAATYAARKEDKYLFKLKNVILQREIDIKGITKLQFNMSDKSGKNIYQIHDEDGLTSTGQLIYLEKGERLTLEFADIPEEVYKSGSNIKQDEIYDFYIDRGFEYGKEFQVIQSIYQKNDEVFACIKLHETREFIVSPYGIDGAFQAIMGLLSEQERTDGIMYVPFSVGEIQFLDQMPMEFVVQMSAKKSLPYQVKIMDLIFMNTDGEVFMKILDYCAAVQGRKYHNSTSSPYLEMKWLKRERIITDKQIKQVFLFDESEELAKRLQKNDQMEVVLAKPTEILNLKTDIKHLFQSSKRESKYIIIHHQAAEYVEAETRMELNKSFYVLLAIAKGLIESKMSKDVTILYVSENDTPLFMAGDGFFKTLADENSKYCCKSILLSDVGKSMEEVVMNELSFSQTGARQIKYENGFRFEKIMNKCQAIDIEKNITIVEDGVYLILGGSGGIGRLLTLHLAKYRATLILAGRSKEDDGIRNHLRRLRELGATVDYEICDISASEETNIFISKLYEKYGKLNGIIHTAGVIRDSIILNKTREEVQQVFDSKIYGSINISNALVGRKFTFLLFFSSTAAVLGNMGQADYSYANAFIDYYVRYLREVKQWNNVFSINWPLWEEGGMQVEDAVKEHYEKKWGMRGLSLEKAIEAIEYCLNSPNYQMIVFEGDTSKLFSQSWMVESERKKGEIFSLVKQEEDTEEIDEWITSYLRQVISRATSYPVNRLHQRVPFEDYGIDSVMIIKLTTYLEEDFDDIPRTLFFEYHTIEELKEYFLENEVSIVRSLIRKEHGSSAIVDTNVPENPGSIKEKTVKADKSITRKSRDIAVVGLAGTYPDAQTLDQFWDNLRGGRDSIKEIDRWDHSVYFDHEGRNGKSYSKWGSFIEDYDKFDPLFFNISPKEAQMMDPQERLFLETAWHTVEDAGYTRAALAKYKVGVYVGCMYSQYQLYGEDELIKSNYIAPSGSYATIANRVSYFFGFRGPSMTIDTMCSSSLSAIHLACESIINEDTDIALAGGVNLTIHPVKYLNISRDHFASSDGYCRSFGKGGDGFVPGEGVGAVLLKTLEKAIEDGDQIYGIIKGSTINHGGKTSSYTVPNPRAQTSAIRHTLEKSGINARDISYVEAHGTGTELGDPIEIAGLKKAYDEYSEDTQYCAIGSLKSNIGHLEAAAGIAAVTKVLLQLKHKKLVPSLHAEELNPNIKFDKSPFYVQKKLDYWNSRIEERIAGISSFGAGGSNAHMIIQEYTSTHRDKREKQTYLITMSAVTPQALNTYVEKMSDFVNVKLKKNQISMVVPVDIEKIETVIMESVSTIIGVEKELLNRVTSFGELGFDVWSLHKLQKKLLEEQLVLSDEQLSLHLTIDILIDKVYRLDDQDEGKSSEDALMLGDIAYTLAVGREAMRTRLAFLASDLYEMKVRLEQFLNHKKDNGENYWYHNNLPEEMGDSEYELPLDYEVGMRLDEIAQKWTHGKSYNFMSMFKTSNYRRISLINYPFSRKKYWIPGIKNQDNNMNFSETITGKEIFLKEHIVDNNIVLPASYYIEMTAQAFTKVYHQSVRMIIEDMTWMSAYVHENSTVFHINLDKKEEHFKFDISSVPDNIYSTGLFYCSDSSHRNIENMDFTSNMMEPHFILDRDEFYRACSQHKVIYGKQYQVVNKVYVKGKTVLSHLYHESKNGDFVVSPYWLDGVFQGITPLLPKDQTYLPFSFEKLELLREISNETYAFIKEIEILTEEIKKFDIIVCDVDGEVIMKVKNFIVKKYYKKKKSSYRLLYFQEKWEDVE